MNRLFHCFFVLVLIFAAGAAQALQPNTKPPVPEEKPKAVNTYLSYGLTTASAYVFRGQNRLADEAQSDQYLVFVPRLAWGIPEIHTQIGASAVIQATGGNWSETRDKARNLEYRLFWSTSYKITQKLRIYGIFNAYLYPHADKESMETSVPTFLEPGVRLAYYLRRASLGVFSSYYLGVQNKDSVRDQSYLYIQPFITKSVRFIVPVSVRFSYGYKIRSEGEPSVEGNNHDLFMSVSARIRAKGFYFRPGFSIGWTDMGEDENGDSIPAGKGVVAWFFLSVGKSKTVKMLEE